MNAWMMCLLCVPAFAALSMGMDKHHEQVHGRELLPAHAWPWRSVGSALLLLALLWSLRSWGTSVAIAAWIGALTFAALCVGLLLTYAPQHLRNVALGCGALSALCAALSML